jgi:hypothetical protein
VDYYCSCLGHLGRLNTDRIIYIYVTPPKVARPRKEGDIVLPGNTKGESIAVLLTSCLTGLDKSVLQIKTKIVSCGKADSKPVKQEVNSKAILSPLVFPGNTILPSFLGLTTLGGVT